jgi:predicted small integral membrane protein
MPSTNYLLRIAKFISMLAIGIMSLLILIGNITDYYTNYHFVEHVMRMDTTFADSTIHYRSVHNSVLFHAAYILIILMELVMSVCCLWGSWLLFKNLRGDPATFHDAKIGP